MSGTCTLDNYQVTLEKQGRQLSFGLSQIEQIAYGRKLDAISAAKLTVATTGPDCCGELGAVDHWNTDLVIAAYHEGRGEYEEMWRGPVRKPRFLKGQVVIEALDVLKWYDLRFLENDMTIEGDVTDIFEAITNDAVLAYDRPVMELVKFEAGVRETRVIDAESRRKAWSVVREMLDAGLDVTTFGRRVLAGLPAFKPFELNDTQVQGRVEVVKDGDEYANRIVGDAAGDIIGVWPEGPRQGRDGYPLVEDSIIDSQLKDAASAQSAAKARFAFSEGGVRRVRADGGLVLLPTANIDAKYLVCGQLVNFTATETCYGATETLRLGSVDFVVEKGTQKATIDLQPMGGVAGTATVEGV